MYNFLSIIKNDDLFDFQKKGNFNNVEFGLLKSPQDFILPFRFFVENGSFLNKFELRKVEITGNEITIISTISLLVSNPPFLTGSRYYSTPTNQILANPIDEGLYYLYFHGVLGFTNHKSELFCVKKDFFEQNYGLVFNIFNSSGYTESTIIDDSGNTNHFTLKNGRCGYSKGDTILKFANHLNLEGYTATNKGSASITIDNYRKTIKIGKGTVYDLVLEKIGNKTFNLPFVENYFYLYDINYSERFIAQNLTWTIQNEFFYLNGMQIVHDTDSGETFYIPYNRFLGVQHNVSRSRVTNSYIAGGNPYNVNEILYHNKNHYKVASAFISSKFSSDIANLILLS